MMSTTPMNAELLARLCNQGATYGAFYLTFNEAVTVLDYVHEHPHVVLTLGPGRVQKLRSFVVFVLPNFPTEPTTTEGPDTP